MLIVWSLPSYLEYEAIHMTREVNDLKIKKVMLDIGNEKAPRVVERSAYFNDEMESGSKNKYVDKVLKEFSLASGLKPNLNKSTIFFGSVNLIEKKRIMEIISMNQNKKQKEVRKFMSQEKLNICGIIESHIKPTKIDNKCGEANIGIDKRDLWKILQSYKNITKVTPWIILGDFNVTIKLEEYSARGSRVNGDMQELIDCVNEFATVLTMNDAVLKQAQCKVEAIPFNKQLKEELDKILEDYEEALFGEEKLLAQKEKTEWLSEGDRNNKYFYHVLKSRKNASKTIGICDENGKWFNEDEVVEAMFDIGNEKAHGPDEFTTLFFKKIWDIMEVITLMMKRKVGQRSEFKFYDGCKEMESTHLCFVNDLLMMCHGDHKLVNVINEVLKEFSLASGLKPNMNKSTIFFGSVNPIEKKRIMEIIRFVEEILPMKYFSILLVTKVIGVMDCSLLVEKVKGKVND
ncbi:hypothetical protein Tco_1110309 [Tanacetum coccineum]|uniref:RNA-directed DNA polymerase, eukaryota, reverse transcriptase zinc-binding domain protein n=1 Tax=Tanacetum coccineum TaxID=301880 RepID=A0ABQ5IIV7_9ASTR